VEVAEHVAHGREHAGVGVGDVEDLALVDQVGEPRGAGLLVEVGARSCALELDELVEAATKAFEDGRRQHVGER